MEDYFMSEEYLMYYYQYRFPVGARVLVQQGDRTVPGTVAHHLSSGTGALIILDHGNGLDSITARWRQLRLDPLAPKLKTAIRSSSLLSPRRSNRVMGGSRRVRRGARRRRSRKSRKTTRRSKAILLRSR